MKKEMKIILPVYKMVYAFAFVVILSLIRGVVFTNEIGPVSYTHLRIKVSEHFAQDGKPLDSLLEDVIQHAAAAS